MTSRPDFRLALAAAISLLAACAAVPPTRFHSLLPAESARAPASPGDAMPIVLDPVRIPPQVDQPQWLVRVPDGSLQLLEQDRWAAPLRDEVHAALLEALALRWAAVDTGSAAPGAARPWRLTVDLVRFESVLGREARVEARWRIAAPAGSAPGAACTSVLRESADSALALVQGHQRIVVRLADEIGATLRALARNAAATGCPASTAAAR